MDFNLGLFVLENLEAAGVIGGYVAISIISFSLIIFASRGKIEGSGQCGPKYLQPIIGALLGVIPGCGATIIASTMYKNGKISFGGLFAAFITTLGEGSFVLLGASAEADVASNLKAFADAPNNTNDPSPNVVINAANRPPNEIFPFLYIVDAIIVAPQPGITPNKAPMIGCKYFGPHWPLPSIFPLEAKIINEKLIIDIATYPPITPAASRFSKTNNPKLKSISRLPS
jgi:hypothetical protein